MYSSSSIQWEKFDEKTSAKALKTLKCLPVIIFNMSMNVCMYVWMHAYLVNVSFQKHKL